MSEPAMMKKSEPLRSKSKKAGLVLPVSRVHARMKKAMGKGGRVAQASPIYLTACLEYVASEVLEAAGKVTLERKRKRISPADLIAGIRGDKDLSRVFGNVEVIVGEQLRDVGAATKYEEKVAEDAEA